MTEKPTTVTEAELAARSVAPRVTEADVLGSIKVVDFYVHKDTCLTICVLTLRNGFTVTGEAACADPANFKQDIGERIAKENAIKKIWPLLGYQLRDKLHNTPTDFAGRLRLEIDELEIKYTKLNEFIGGQIFPELTEKKKLLLKQQRELMRGYLSVVHDRISLEIN